MLKPYKNEIKNIAVLFAHVGIEEDKGNRIYEIAAAVLNGNKQTPSYESLIRYHHSRNMQQQHIR